MVAAFIGVYLVIGIGFTIGIKQSIGELEAELFDYVITLLWPLFLVMGASAKLARWLGE